MKTLILLFAVVVSMAATGCATNHTEQRDISYEAITNGTRIASVPIRETRTTTKARTFFDSKSSLANFKATQSDKTQATSIGSLTQEASGTNAVEVLARIEAILRAAK